MQYEINLVSEAERQQWEKLYYQYAEFYQVEMNAEILDTVWGWIHAKDQPFYALIAKDHAGNGLGLMHFRAMLSPLRGTQTGFLDDLFVQPGVRGSGLVDAMFKQLQSFASQQGWPLLRWITAEDNYRARAVYDKISDKTRWITYQMNLNS